MLATLSISATFSIAGFLFCLLKLKKINKIKKINMAEPIKNKKWRKFLIYLIIFFSSSFILIVSFFFSNF